MKRIFAIVFTLLALNTTNAQFFEGKITYQTTYTSKMPGMKSEQFNQAFGNKQEYYIRGGNYKSVTNGTFAQWQLFINKDNKLYNKTGTSDTLLWNDVSDYNDPVTGVELRKGAVEILGYSCDELTLTSGTGTQKYYFNSKLGVDTKLFAKHQYGHWDIFLKKANALPLKMVIVDKQFTLVSVATEVKPMKLEDSFFQLPAGSKMKKSPY